MAHESSTTVARAPRASVMLSATVFRDHSATSLGHRVVNLSATGVRLSPGNGLQVGETVSVSIGMMDHIPAEVVRVHETAAALRFLFPIDVEEARKRRVGGPVTAPKSGWLGEMQDSYSR